jgi:DNA (cytosine-5)-methyltransferase 1
LKIVDLFCGAGGFSSGFVSTNAKHLAIDSDPQVLTTYACNYPEARTVQRDIGRYHSTELENDLGGRPDILLASPPCEEFSRANPDSSSPAAERIYGTGTARLLLDTIRLIGDLSPDIFVIENVGALLQKGGRQIVEREFQHIGVENVHFNLIRAHQHGNPSKRLRVFISNIELKLPRIRPPEVMSAIGNLPPLGIDSLFTPQNTVPNHELRILTKDRLKAVRKTRYGRGARHFRGSKDRDMPNWVRLYPDQIATSIIGLSRYIHPFEDRMLSVREHARLMSYPDTFIFKGHIESQYNQVGESVPPIISSLIAQEVQKKIE